MGSFAVTAGRAWERAQEARAGGKRATRTRRKGIHARKRFAKVMAEYYTFLPDPAIGIGQRHALDLALLSRRYGEAILVEPVTLRLGISELLERVSKDPSAAFTPVINDAEEVECEYFVN